MNDWYLIEICKIIYSQFKRLIKIRGINTVNFIVLILTFHFLSYANMSVWKKNNNTKIKLTE